MDTFCGYKVQYESTNIGFSRTFMRDMVLCHFETWKLSIIFNEFKP